ncbi:hypothetical protein AVEN_261567-1 [Araneus ventricosus]|uniref:Uncharacterized protein n=1 Tax=Araneus ventricosus TaxID=182803 RepID=A0A4Y2EBP9_ARAVE|nr:hypothetical protein AVEN_261567-1 [Araneus ventricosus]
MTLKRIANRGTELRRFYFQVREDPEAVRIREASHCNRGNFLASNSLTCLGNLEGEVWSYGTVIVLSQQRLLHPAFGANIVCCFCRRVSDQVFCFRRAEKGGSFGTSMFTKECDTVLAVE